MTQSKWKMNLEGEEQGGPIPAGSWAITLWPAWPGRRRMTSAFSHLSRKPQWPEPQEILPSRLLAYLSRLLGVEGLSHPNVKTYLLGHYITLYPLGEEELIYRISVQQPVQWRIFSPLDCPQNAFLYKLAHCFLKFPKSQKTYEIPFITAPPVLPPTLPILCGKQERYQ